MRVDSLPHRKWKYIKQQPSTLPGPAVPGCCLVSFHFLWGKLSTRTVVLTLKPRIVAIVHTVHTLFCLTLYLVATLTGGKVGFYRSPIGCQWRWRVSHYGWAPHLSTHPAGPMQIARSERFLSSRSFTVGTCTAPRFTRIPGVPLSDV